MTVADAGRVDTIDGYDAVVLGSAVYAGHWLPDAKNVAERSPTCRSSRARRRSTWAQRPPPSAQRRG